MGQGEEIQMLSPLRNRFGIPGVISVIALVFAMTGGAFAAKYVITSTKQIKPSVVKALKGKKGPAGPAGAQGPAGPAGPKGDTGAQGPQGKEGSEGKEGPEGKAGKDGKTGFTDTLPSGKTETGSWFLSSASTIISLPFNIPLANPIGEANVHYVAASTSDCPGSAADPQAEEGHLCVYEEFNSGTPPTTFIWDPATEVGGESFFPKAGAATSGAILAGPGYEGVAFGTWAVTAP